MAVTIEVLCTRTAEGFAAWQMATFKAIMTTYNDLTCTCVGSRASRKGD